MPWNRGSPLPTYAMRPSPLDRARQGADTERGRKPSSAQALVVQGRTKNDTTYAEVYLYDEIGFYGITAAMFAQQLGELEVDEIDLHVNSPGGEVWDGIAMYNALVNHTAKVNVYVDGIAASAASVVVMAGDYREMARGAQMMIHDAWGLCVGNCADMTAMAQRLDDESNNLAKLYADRSGGSSASWRKAMVAESWYSADQAVAAGLADGVSPKPDTGATDDVAARWDLSVFGYRYEGCAKAPEPTMPAGRRPAAGPRPVANGPDPADPPAPPESPSGPAEPDPAPEPDPTPLEAPEGLGDWLKEAVVAAAAPPSLNLDPGLFRDAVAQAANDMPAVSAPATAVTPTPSDAERGGLLANALKGALQ